MVCKGVRNGRSYLVSNDKSMRIVDKGETLRLLNEQSRGLVFTRLQVFGSTLYEHTASVPRFHQQLRPLQEHGTAHAGTISVISTGRVVPVLATPLASLADACLLQLMHRKAFAARSMYSDEVVSQMTR